MSHGPDQDTQRERESQTPQPRPPPSLRHLPCPVTTYLNNLRYCQLWEYDVTRRRVMYSVVAVYKTAVIRASLKPAVSPA